VTRRIHTQLFAISRMVETLAALYPDAVAALADRRDTVDGYSAGSNGPKVMASAELTSTEAAAEARLHASRCIADLDAGLTLLAATVHDMTRECRHALADTPREEPTLCSCHGHDGAELARADGGWSDPTCRRLATRGGLCDACYLRKRAWVKRAA
jgi:hypothetical protein